MCACMELYGKLYGAFTAGKNLAHDVVRVVGKRCMQGSHIAHCISAFAATAGGSSR